MLSVFSFQTKAQTIGGNQTNNFEMSYETFEGFHGFSYGFNKSLDNRLSFGGGISSFNGGTDRLSEITLLSARLRYRIANIGKRITIFAGSEIGGGLMTNYNDDRSNQTNQFVLSSKIFTEAELKINKRFSVFGGAGYNIKQGALPIQNGISYRLGLRINMSRPNKHKEIRKF